MNEKAYFPAIDGLRLLASLNIVMLHLSSSAALGYMASWAWILPVVKAPAFAAGLFFILAGFLFASKFNDPDRRMPVIPFMFARIAKLYRLHFAMTVLMFVVLIVKLGGISHLFHPIRSLLLHLTLAWSFVPNLGMELNEPSWSLTGFFICYAVTPFCASRLARIENPRTLWILCGLVFIPGILWGLLFSATSNVGVLPILGDFSNFDVRYRFFHICPFIRIFEYLFGMILFRLYKVGAFEIFRKNYVAGAAQILCLVLLYVSIFTMQSSNVAWNFICHHSVAVAIYGGFVISLTTTKGWLSKIFCIPIVRMIGRASFYPYLIHLPFISIAWAICNLNTPLATLGFLIFIYTVSTLYQKHKDHVRMLKKKAHSLPVPTGV